MCRKSPGLSVQDIRKAIPPSLGSTDCSTGKPLPVRRPPSLPPEEAHLLRIRHHGHVQLGRVREGGLCFARPAHRGGLYAEPETSVPKGQDLLIHR